RPVVTGGCARFAISLRSTLDPVGGIGGRSPPPYLATALGDDYPDTVAVLRRGALELSRGPGHHSLDQPSPHPTPRQSTRLQNTTTQPITPTQTEAPAPRPTLLTGPSSRQANPRTNPARGTQPGPRGGGAMEVSPTFGDSRPSPEALECDRPL